MNSIIIVKDDELYVGTWDLAKGFELDHRNLTNLVKKYAQEFEELDDHRVALEMRPVYPKNGGNPFDEFLLNEEQSIYITTLLRNTAIIRKFKRRLSKEFVKQRRAIENFLAKARVAKQNEEWHQLRQEGKRERRLETDTIKKFVEYAFNQGSKDPRMYYMAITKMENCTLFYIELIAMEFSNFRDIVDGYGLNILQMADRIVAKALEEGMEANMYYKDIYKLAKARVESFASVIGRTPVQVIGNGEKKQFLAMNPMKYRQMQTAHSRPTA